MALRWSWILAVVRYGSGAKSSGDCHVLGSGEVLAENSELL